MGEEGTEGTVHLLCLAASSGVPLFCRSSRRGTPARQQVGPWSLHLRNRRGLGAWILGLQGCSGWGSFRVEFRGLREQWSNNPCSPKRGGAKRL